MALPNATNAQIVTSSTIQLTSWHANSAMTTVLPVLMQAPALSVTTTISSLTGHASPVILQDASTVAKTASVRSAGLGTSWNQALTTVNLALHLAKHVTARKNARSVTLTCMLQPGRLTEVVGATAREAGDRVVRTSSPVTATTIS